MDFLPNLLIHQETLLAKIFADKGKESVMRQWMSWLWSRNMVEIAGVCGKHYLYIPLTHPLRKKNTYVIVFNNKYAYIYTHIEIYICIHTHTHIYSSWVKGWFSLAVSLSRSLSHTHPSSPFANGSQMVFIHFFVSEASSSIWPVCWIWSANMFLFGYRMF